MAVLCLLVGQLDHRDGYQTGTADFRTPLKTAAFVAYDLTAKFDRFKDGR
jgi:hypothetical protein